LFTKSRSRSRAAQMTTTGLGDALISLMLLLETAAVEIKSTSRSKS
jgi:hypothetical protein